MMIADNGEDKIVICKKCKYAVNAEVLGIDKDSKKDKKVKCPKCKSSNTEFKRGIEVGNIFKLGTKYSIPQKLFYKDKDNKSKPVIMGSYGIGVGRLLASVIEASHDKNGIIWPQSIAPYQVYLIGIGQDKTAQKIYQDLVKAGIEVFYDDRDVSPGEKFADADLLGIPYRLTISAKTLKEKSIELKERNKKTAIKIKLNKIIETLVK